MEVGVIVGACTLTLSVWDAWKVVGKPWPALLYVIVIMYGNRTVIHEAARSQSPLYCIKAGAELFQSVYHWLTRL